MYKRQVYDLGLVGKRYCAVAEDSLHFIDQKGRAAASYIEIMLLEFSSSIMCLILSGKVGSNIASEIGTMRVTQQIDALEIMGPFFL